MHILDVTLFNLFVIVALIALLAIIARAKPQENNVRRCKHRRSTDFEYQELGEHVPIANNRLFCYIFTYQVYIALRKVKFMALLNQIIAIEKGVKARAYSDLSQLNKTVQKPELFNGFTKTYQKKDEDGEDLASEQKRVQYVVSEVLRVVERTVGELLDVTARKDWTNCIAKANVVIDGQELFVGAPVSFLLFIEKQVTDLRTFIGNLPILDGADDWHKDANTGLYKAEPVQTHRTKKVSKPIVMYPATPEHPAQTQLLTEDIIAGYWRQEKQSGAIPKVLREKLLERADKLLRAVKEARESANVAVEVETPNVSAAIFGFLFEGI